MNATAPTDHELMLAVRDGDVGHLGELFERYQLPLYGFFVRMTSQRTQSEDLVQQVFYRILKYRHTYRDEGNFRAWMYHLARKVAADYFRKSRTSEVPSDDGETERLPDTAPDSSEVAAANDEVELMRVAFSQLEAPQREVLTLLRFQQLPHEEIADLLGCSVGAAKVRAHRALKSLREIYLRLQGRDSAPPAKPF